MKRFYQQGYTQFSYKMVVKETDKARLIEIAPEVQIWLPKNWITKLNKTSFTVKDHFATDIKLKIKAEYDAR